MKYLIFFATGIIGCFVTISGIQALAEIFLNLKMTLLEAFVLSLAWSFLRNNPLKVQKTLNEMDTGEVVGVCVAILIMDCAAVYWMIPWLGERLQ